MTPSVPPGPPAGLFGTRFVRQFREQPLELLTGIARDYSPLAHVRLGFQRLYFVNEPELIRQVLVTHSKSLLKLPAFMKLFSQVDGSSVFTTEGPAWLRKRRIVQKAFHPQRMVGYADTTTRLARRMIGGWHSGQELEITETMTQLTLEVIAQTMFGIDVRSDAPRLGEAVQVLSRIFTREAGQLWHWPLWAPVPSARQKRQAIAALDEVIWRVIRQRQASGRDEGDLLSLLLSAVDDEGDGRGLSEKEVRDEAVTLMNAGHDTTAAALSWAWYLLATHPAQQQALIDELRQVVGDRPVEPADVPRLVHLDHAIKETLRLYPSAWILFVRRATQHVALGQYTIPKGSWVYVSPYAMHRMPQYFTEPDQFRPERFAAPNWPQYAYLPFGGGPHLCVGSQLATQEMALTLATGLQRFRVELAAGQGPVEAEPLVAVRPRGGVRLRWLAHQPLDRPLPVAAGN